MSRLTTDRDDVALTHSNNSTPTEQAEAYLVLPDEDLAKSFVRTVRRSYVHSCGAKTTMSVTIAETYARDPNFYDGTYCTGCRMHRPVVEFVWDGTEEIVGS